MTDPAPPPGPTRTVRDKAAMARLRKRHGAEKRFRLLGIAAIGVAMFALILLLFSIVHQGRGAFYANVAKLDIRFDAAVIDPGGDRDPKALRQANYTKLVRDSLRGIFPDVTQRRDKKRLYALMSQGAAYDLQDMVLADPSLIGTTRTVPLPFADDADLYLKGHISKDVPEADRRLRDDQIAWLDTLRAEGRAETVFNTRFLTSGDSREPELAGIGGAIVGTILTLAVTFLLSFPIGVATAVYLEEFAPRNRMSDFI